MKHTVPFLALLFIGTAAFAQQPTPAPSPAPAPAAVQTNPSVLKFNETTHDFGTVKQNDKTETIFKFTNTGSKPIKLTTVKASCGCTTPKYTAEEVAPGGTGEITVSYNSSRVGDFNKSITVKYDDSLATATVLFIKGKVDPVEPAAAIPGQENKPAMNTIPPGGTSVPVTPSVATQTPPPAPTPAPEPVKDNYTTPRGALWFENMIQNAGELTSDGSASVTYKFKNKSDKPVTILDKYDAEPSLIVKPSHKVVQPGQESTIIVTVDGKKMKEANEPSTTFSKRIGITTDETVDATKFMTVNGTYKVVFSATEKANSPTISFETIDVNGGKIIEGEKFEYKFKFTNTGKSDLVITAAKATCGCTATKPPVDAIKPGESDYIVATFDSRGRLGVNNKTIVVTSNDVNNPSVTLKFTVEVEKDPFHAPGMSGGDGHDHEHDEHDGHGH